MRETTTIEIAPNWTSLAGALEAILAHLGTPLPRHAVMGLTGLAWHLCLGTKGGVTALPSGPTDMDKEAVVGRFRRTGWRWERFAATVDPENADATREAAIAWATSRLDRGIPLVGWDLRLHEYGVVGGYDRERRGFLVSDVLAGEAGALAPWERWPSALGQIELYAPTAPVEDDTLETIASALETALACFAGKDGPADGQPRGTGALDAWADAFESDTEVDRAGNAYTLAVLQAARLDGAAFLEDVAAALPELHETLDRAERALRDEGQALAPLITLFPFPAAGHGNITNAGLRRAAATALRRAAALERAAAEELEAALAVLRGELAAG